MDGSNVLKNTLWKFAEKCGAQGVSMVVAIVLARLLSPDDYGTIAIVTVFINLFGIFLDLGFSAGLIQKKDADELDFSSIFWLNLGICLFIYTILFFASPLAARFYNDERLTAMIRALGLTFIISSLKNVQGAYVSKHMQFRLFFLSTLGGTIGAAFIGIWMAYAGFGAWALIAQSLFNNAVDTLILLCTVKWHPRLMFSFSRVKALFSFGWKLLLSGIIDTYYNNLRSLIIGKVYTATDLALYNKGKGWPELFVSNINDSINSTLFPSMSAVQNDTFAVKSMTRRAIKLSTYIMAPMLIGLAFIGTPFIRLVLTEKWLPSVPYMVIFCITYTFYPIHTANLNAIKAMGRSDLFLKLEIIKKIVGLIALAITVPISVMAMGYSLLFTSVASQIINSWPNRKLLNYGYLEQLKDILPGILLAVAMGCCIYPIQWIGLPDIVTLCIQVPLGVVIYILGSKLFKLDSFEYLWGIIKPYIKKKGA